MKSWILVTGLIFASCSQVKELRERETFVNTFRQSREETYIEKKDSTFEYHPALEKSQNHYAADSSFLETSLAWSAATWKDGILSHSIENKPSVPIRVPTMIEYKTFIIRDTIADYLYLTDEHTKKVEKFRFMNAFFYGSGIAGWAIVSLLIIVKIWKRRFRI